MREAAPTSRASQDPARAHEPPDRGGEELADDARIWRVYDKIGREDDRERITTWNRGLDNLALFAGLFSAVTTAFIVEAQDDLKPNYSELTFRVLNASVAGDHLVLDRFVVPAGARAANCLLIASLLLSLSAALIAIMGKDWIGMYAARPICNPRQWAEMRTYRLRCIQRWRMSGVIASAPVLLHLSLLLFTSGLVLFVSPDPSTQLVTLGLSVALAALYVVMSLSAVLFASSPFRSPATQKMRALLARCLVLLVLPKRNALGSLQEAINGLVAPDLKAFSQRRLVRWSGAGVFWDRGHVAEAGDQHFMEAAVRHFLAFMRSFMGKLRTALRSVPLRVLFVRRRDSAVPAPTRRVGIWEKFQISKWTDLRTECTPQFVADSLSWLSSTSQSPDVFRALVCALGDLDVGGQVGLFVSSSLRERIRADIRHSWRKADFLTLSRYVLADRNLSHSPHIEPFEFETIFDLEKEPSLRCEDGLAAIIRIEAFNDPDVIRKYCPDVVSQPRMVEMLFPDLSLASHGYHSLISLMNCYHRFFTKDVLAACERTLVRRLLSSSRKQAYRAAVQDLYGGRSGLVELLTFLAMNERYPNNPTIRLVDPAAAVELIRHVLPVDRREHCCLAYLFGTRTRSVAGWSDDGAARLQNWSPYELAWLLSALPLAPYYSYDLAASLGEAQGSQNAFETALARTTVLVLSPERAVESFMLSCGGEKVSTRALSARLVYALLCDPRSSMSDDDKIGLIQLTLETNALSWLHSESEWFHDDRRAACLEIAIAIAQVLEHLLAAPVHRDSLATRLFELFVFTKTQRAGFSTVWDLGGFLRSEIMLLREPHRADCIRRLLTALKAIHPLCQLSEALRSHWDRIGLPGNVEEWSYNTDEALSALFIPDRSNVHNPAPNSGSGGVIDGPTDGEHDSIWWLDSCMT